MLQVRVKDIPAEGLTLKDVMSVESFAFLKDDFIRFKAPVEVAATVHKVDLTILAQTVSEGHYVSKCSRCLENVEKPWKVDFDFDVPIDRKTDFVDLTEEIRQEIILNIPATLYCSDDCKGLCVGCGVNLNLEKCKCNVK